MGYSGPALRARRTTLELSCTRCTTLDCAPRRISTLSSIIPIADRRLRLTFDHIWRFSGHPPGNR